MKLTNYIEDKRKTNAKYRDIVTGLLHIIGPQLAEIGDKECLEKLRELAQLLNNKASMQVRIASKVVERARKEEGRPPLPRQYLLEKLVEQWYKKG